MAQGTKIYNSLPKNTLKSVNFNQYEANNISHKWLSHHFAQMSTLWISAGYISMTLKKMHGQSFWGTNWFFLFVHVRFLRIYSWTFLMNHFVWRRERKKKHGPAVREITWRFPSMKMLDVLSLHATVRATLDSQYRGFSNNVEEKAWIIFLRKCPSMKMLDVPSLHATARSVSSFGFPR